MPREINVAIGLRDGVTTNPDIKQSLYNTDLYKSSGYYGYWKTTTATGGGLSVVIPDADIRETCECEVSGSAGTSFLKTTTSPLMSSGTWHVALFELISVDSGTVDAPIFKLEAGTGGVTGLTPGATIPATNTPGVYGIVFQMDGSGTVVQSMGLGVDTDQTADCKITVGYNCILDLSSETDPIPEYIYKHGNYATLEKAGATLAKTNNTTHNATSGLISYSFGADLDQDRLHTVGLFVGDSYSNDSNEWPAECVSDDGHMVLLGSGKGSEPMGNFLADLPDVLALTDFKYPESATTPDFVVIQGSVNSINSADDGAAILQDYSDMIDLVNAAGKRAFCTNIPNVSGLDTTDNKTKTRYIRDNLPATCTAKSATYIDVALPLQGSVAEDNVTATYEHADGIHLKPAGWTLYGQTVAAAIDSMRSTPIPAISTSASLSSMQTDIVIKEDTSISEDVGIQTDKAIQ